MLQTAHEREMALYEELSKQGAMIMNHNTRRCDEDQ
jgi:hypothetical protein